MIAGLLRRGAGNAYVLSQLPGQRRMPFARRARIERLRDARVRSLVRYAAATVPHYRDAFRQLSLDPRDIRTAADLERLPLIRKEDLQRDPERFVSTSWLGRRSVEFVTSGTTGQRGRVLHDPLSLLANIAWGEREREVVTNLIGRTAGYREAVIGYPSGTIEKVWQFYRETTYVPTRPDRLVLSVQSPLHENVEAVNRFGPDVLATFGSYLEALSRAVAAGGAALRQPRLLLYGAESLLPPARRDIEAVLGAPVLANYNAVEAFKIGFMCEERAGYHVHEDLAHLRIADADGRTVPDGEQGCVVLSNLVNRGTVLLNYRLSDVAASAPGPCRCGRNFRLLGEIEGRIEDLLTLANGEVLHPRAVWAVVKPRAEIIQYQLVQQAPDRYLLKLVTADEDSFARVAAPVTRQMEDLLGAGSTAAKVDTVRCAELPREGGGKVRLVVALRR
jgi:phenylacetate-CoA ligase